MIGSLSFAIDLLEREVKAQVRLRPDYQRLLTVSGIGTVLGPTIMLETGEIGRFARVGNYASYCRCVGSERPMPAGMIVEDRDREECNPSSAPATPPAAG